jgi:hypothetical protein
VIERPGKGEEQKKLSKRRWSAEGQWMKHGWRKKKDGKAPKGELLLLLLARRGNREAVGKEPINVGLAVRLANEFQIIHNVQTEDQLEEVEISHCRVLGEAGMP